MFPKTPGALNDSNQVSADASVNYTTNKAKLTNETTSAWWVSGGLNPPATYTARLTETLTLSNGSTVVVSGKGMFAMYRPQARITATTGVVALDTNQTIAQGCSNIFGLHYGIPSNCGGTPGIVFSNSYTWPYQFSGTYQWVQVISDYVLRYQSNDGSSSWIKKQATNVLDTTYPYDPHPVRTEDSPGANIDPPFCLSKRMTALVNFAMWLEFRPTNGPTGPINGQWVPLRQIVWSYGGEALLFATNCSPNSWAGINFTNNVNPADFDTQQYPKWWNNVTNIQYQPE